MNLLVADRRPAYVSPSLWFKQRSTALVLLVAIADLLFYDVPAAGLPIALFLVLLLAAAAAFNRLRSSGQSRLAAIVLVVAAVAALAMDANPLSVALAIGLSAAGIVLLVHGAAGWLTVAAIAILMPLGGWLRFAADLLLMRRAMSRRGRLRFDILGWIVPVGLSLFFLAVFLAANPVIERWAALLRPDRLMLVDGPRFLFWLTMALLVWPILHLVRSRRTLPFTLPAAGESWSSFLGEVAVRRSLVSFNLLFALQTLTDAGYLWGGAALPEGMTHAEYAHRGAYPLMVAAMVAAAFVLVALRHDSDGQRPRALKPLLLVFVGQGLVLVASSMLRLDLYVGAYSLTLWRVAAFIWMGLVAFGFVTILIRIVSGQSTRWLLNVNASAALVTLWVCCLVDLAGLVTAFNIAHSREATGQGPQLDLTYIAHTFGAQAIPALDSRRDLLAGQGKHWITRVDGVWISISLDDWRDQMARKALATEESWRTWSFADWRLRRYLSEAPQWAAFERR
ncbi:DUF4173 domain-containing protein [Pleomorphomonas diazotrophica]|uniref:DUF4173 domain-containing protein n=1 Tax=Pleomorphomonas diazotrophica TaxID=1166257 RepID=A0A1I4VL08_9HYPH|nr:DUF4173 domain-containing protein [Pleomorphomonas diazotrophica]PKR89651.1 DUF4173 domain-containing protein [Pleomorphomonas diazotrophica]SFN01686.1 protein of unknown function [Pleomorphomonas diazotrophica]